MDVLCWAGLERRKEEGRGAWTKDNDEEGGFEMKG